MALNAAKIRLSAPDSMLLAIGANQVDLGSSEGGAELTYNPTNFDVKIDQVIMPVAAFKTMEEVIFAVALAQYQVNLINMAFDYAYANVATVTGTPNTDTAYFGGTATVTTGTFDFTCPKLDGTTNKIRGHLNKVYSAKSVKLNYQRDKNTTISKVEFQALADLTQSSGSYAGWIREEYALLPMIPAPMLHLDPLVTIAISIAQVAALGWLAVRMARRLRARLGPA